MAPGAFHPDADPGHSHHLFVGIFVDAIFTAIAEAIIRRGEGR